MDQDREKLRQARLDEFRKAVAIGEEEAKRGAFGTMTLEELKAEVRRRLEARGSKS